VILLDAYALVAFLGEEPAAEEVESLMRGGDTAVTVVNLAEAIDVTRRVHSVTPDALRAAIEPLVGEVLTVLGQSEGDAWRAADLRARYYDRARRPLSLADCFLVAAAGSDDEIATSDPPLAQMAREEAIAVVALPDSTGFRP
jgi:predicted nucleic acid-binding protein